MKNITMEKEKRGSIIMTGFLGMAAAIGVWALVAFSYGLAQVDWNIAEMLREFLVSVGAIG